MEDQRQALVNRLARIAAKSANTNDVLVNALIAWRENVGPDGVPGPVPPSLNLVLKTAIELWSELHRAQTDLELFDFRATEKAKKGE